MRLDTSLLSTPFNTDPWNYSGNEHLESIPNPNIVDWVLVDIGDKNEQSFELLSQKAGFILSDGKIIDLAELSIIQ